MWRHEYIRRATELQGNQTTTGRQERVVVLYRERILVLVNLKHIIDSLVVYKERVKALCCVEELEQHMSNRGAASVIIYNLKARARRHLLPRTQARAIRRSLVRTQNEDVNKDEQVARLQREGCSTDNRFAIAAPLLPLTSSAKIALITRGLVNFYTRLKTEDRLNTVGARLKTEDRLDTVGARTPRAAEAAGIAILFCPHYENLDAYRRLLMTQR